MTQILRLPEVIKYSGLSRSTIYSYIDQGLWTKPVSLGARSVGWPMQEVEAINRARISGKSNEEIYKLICKLMEQRKIMSGDTGLSADL